MWSTTKAPPLVAVGPGVHRPWAGRRRSEPLDRRRITRRRLALAPDACPQDMAGFDFRVINRPLEDTRPSTQLSRSAASRQHIGAGLWVAHRLVRHERALWVGSNPLCSYPCRMPSSHRVTETIEWMELPIDADGSRNIIPSGTVKLNCSCGWQERVQHLHVPRATREHLEAQEG